MKNYSAWLAQELKGIQVGSLKPWSKSRPYDVVVGTASKEERRLWTLYTAALTLLGAMTAELGVNASHEARTQLMDAVKTYRNSLEKRHLLDHPRLASKRMVTVRQGWKVVFVDEAYMRQQLG